MFNEAKSSDISALISSGIIPAEDISNISKVIQRPSFARLCRYLVSINDRLPSKGIDPRDSFATAMTTLVKTMEELVNIMNSLHKNK